MKGKEAQVFINEEGIEVHLYAKAVRGNSTLIGNPQYDKEEQTFTAHNILHLTKSQYDELEKAIVKELFPPMETFQEWCNRVKEENCNAPWEDETVESMYNGYKREKMETYYGNK